MQLSVGLFVFVSELYLFVGIDFINRDANWQNVKECFLDINLT